MNKEKFFEFVRSLQPTTSNNFHQLIFALRILVRVAAKIDESDVTLINFTQFRCEFLKSIQKLATCCATANITKNRTRWHVTPERFLAQHRITKNRRCKSTSVTSALNRGRARRVYAGRVRPRCHVPMHAYTHARTHTYNLWFMRRRLYHNVTKSINLVQTSSEAFTSNRGFHTVPSHSQQHNTTNTMQCN